MASESPPAFVPSSFGRYQLLERLAVGGMAEIFRARQSGAHGFEKILVIKRILPHLAADPEFLAMFIDEAKLQCALQLGLVDEHGEELGIGGEVRKDALDDEDLLEAVRARLAGAENLGHPANRETLEQLIPAKRTGYECRR